MPPVADGQRLCDVDPGARVHVLQPAVVQRRVDGAEVEVGAGQALRRRYQPDLRLPALLLPGVALRREVVDAVGGHVIDRVGQRGVGEVRLVEVLHVVHDHVGTAGAGLIGELADVVGEAEESVERRGEAQLGGRCHVVRDLQHGAALVEPASVGRAVLDHDHGRRVRSVARARQVAALHVVLRVDPQRGAEEGAGGGVVGVGQGADGDAAPVDAGGLHPVGALEGDALRGGPADVRARADGLGDGAGAGEAGQRAH